MKWALSEWEARRRESVKERERGRERTGVHRDGVVGLRQSRAGRRNGYKEDAGTKEGCEKLVGLEHKRRGRVWSRWRVGVMVGRRGRQEWQIMKNVIQALESGANQKAASIVVYHTDFNDSTWQPRRRGFCSLISVETSSKSDYLSLLSSHQTAVYNFPFDLSAALWYLQPPP